MNFTLVKPESSFISHLTYVHPHKFLMVRIDDHKYGYFNVSYQRFAAFAHSESKGQYYNRHIKGHYDMIHLHEKKFV